MIQATLAAAMGFLLAGPAAAHGELAPRHGGIVGWAGELGLEIVLKADRTLIYVEDHGDTVEMLGGSAIADFGTGPSRTTVKLVPSGGNEISGPPSRATPGQAITVLLTLPDGRVVRGRLIAK